MVSWAITWVHLLVAGIAGFGLGIGLIVGAAILRWSRAGNGGGGVNNPRDPPAIDDGKHRA